MVEDRDMTTFETDKVSEKNEDINKERFRLLLSATNKLERHRSLQSEREASLLFSSHLLSYPLSEIISSQLDSTSNVSSNNTNDTNDDAMNPNNNGSSSNDINSLSNLAGGVQDAHAALVECCLPSANAPGNSGDTTINSNDSTLVISESIANGQMAQVCRNTALSTALSRASKVSSLLHANNKQSQDDYQTYQSLMKLMTKQQQNDSVDVLDIDNENASKDPLEPWFRIFYARLRDIREYHAKHDTAKNIPGKNNHNPSLPLFPIMPTDNDEPYGKHQNEILAIPTSNQNINASTLAEKHKKRTRKGNPEADGYDLSSIISTECNKMIDGGVFSGEEVLGKYLDLNLIHDFVIQKGICTIFQAAQTPNISNDGSHTSDTNPVNINSNEATHVNDQNIKTISYLDFLSILLSGLATTLPEQLKLTHRKKYIKFLQMLKEYLHQFLNKTSPLLNIQADIFDPSMKQFDMEWRDKGGIEGWQQKIQERAMVMLDSPSNEEPTNTTHSLNSSNNNSNNNNNNNKELDLSIYNNPEELEQKVDKDTLKIELSRLGMKCGGTPLDRAKRLFLTKNTPLDQIPKKHFVKKGKKSNSGDDGVTATIVTNDKATVADTIYTPKGSHIEYINTGNERRVDIARLETIVTSLLHQLRPTLDATARRADRRLTQTANERDREIQEETFGTLMSSTSNKRSKPNDAGDNDDGDDDDDDDDDDEEAPIYNPKGVPLGWDGKPIPYWLFKLHGLNHFFPCEICGNESYRGRRNFEKHFTESKHAYGMRCLGIPNTKHFHGVTKIEDALKLWEKLKGGVEGNIFDGGRDEEYEDSHGNVLKRGEYEDLARQGLL